MPTKKSTTDGVRSALTDYAIHVPLGAGQLLIEKGKELTVKVGSFAQDPRKRVRRTYADLAKRGEKVARDLRHSKLGRRLGQTKAATDTVRKAVTGTMGSTTRPSTRKAS
jgi:hypothetical protein